MNEKQREDVVKFLYDLAKLTYTGLIIGGIISPKGLLWIHILFGVCASIIFLLSPTGLERNDHGPADVIFYTRDRGYPYRIWHFCFRERKRKHTH